MQAVLDAERFDQSQGATPEDIAWAEHSLEDLQAQIHAQDESLFGRLSAWPSWVRRTAATVVGVASAGFVFAWKPRPDLHAYPSARMALVLLSLFAAGLWLGADALRSWHRPALSFGGATLRVGLSLALLVGLSVLPVPIELSPYTTPPRGMPLLVHAGSCLLFGLGIALPTFLVCQALSRGAPYTTWMAAVVSGLVGNLALQLHCPITEHAHLLVGHAGLGIVVLLYAAMVLKFRGDELKMT